MYKTIFPDAVADVQTDAKKWQEIGLRRLENHPVYGLQEFRYVINRSGGTLAAGSLAAYEGVLNAAVANTGTGTTYATRAANSWITDGAIVGAHFFVVDDAGAAGAAPEGEQSILTRVTALRIDFLPALSAALANADTVNWLRPHHVIAAAAAMNRGKVAGVVQGALVNNAAGWVQTRGLCPEANMVAAGTAVTEDQYLVAGAGILIVNPTVAADYLAATWDYAKVLTGVEGVLGRAVQALTSDTVRRKTLVDLFGN